MRSCGQTCPYNTPTGCKVKEYNAICPLTNMAILDFAAATQEKPQTNADRIRTMSDEELAKFIAVYSCPPAAERVNCGGVCHECWACWLKQPTDGGE